MLFLKFSAPLKQYRLAVESSPWSVEACAEACTSDHSPQTARPVPRTTLPISHVTPRVNMHGTRQATDSIPYDLHLPK